MEHVIMRVVDGMMVARNMHLAVALRGSNIAEALASGLRVSAFVSRHVALHAIVSPGEAC